MAYITHPTTKLHTKPAPFMAAFSSKGPNTIIPEILKVLIIIRHQKNAFPLVIYCHGYITNLC